MIVLVVSDGQVQDKLLMFVSAGGLNEKVTSPVLFRYPWVAFKKN